MVEISKMNEYILERQIKEYLKKEYYPLHMPGHKRNMSPAPGLPFELDMTEVSGMDDLHRPEGILKQAMERTSILFGAEKTWYLVNGSTGGNLAAMRAVAPYGSEVIVARNCHKSVCHAIELGNLQVHWIYPQVDKTYGIAGSILPAEVGKMLQRYPSSKAVFLTSPTYEGVLSDIEMIAALCHEANIPLLIDAAHGAHLGLFQEGNFAQGAVQLGADVVVQSMHKTLPSMTQTALLHLNGTLVSVEEIERQLSVFETSSPSYPFLISIDGCTGVLREHGKELFKQWGERLSRFSQKAVSLDRFQILGYGNDFLEDHPSIWQLDKSKILIRSRVKTITGNIVARTLRERFRMEMEMSLGNSVLAMTSFCDLEDILDRLADALHEMQKEPVDALDLEGDMDWKEIPAETSMTIADAMAKAGSSIGIQESVNKIAGEYIWAYPPGVPLLVPGERITLQFVELYIKYSEQGTQLHHTRSKHGKIWCLNQ